MKRIILFLLITIALYGGYALNHKISRLQGEQSASDMHFQERLRHMLQSRKTLSLDHLEPSQWDEVCFIHLATSPRLVIANHLGKAESSIILDEQYKHFSTLSHFAGLAFILDDQVTVFREINTNDIRLGIASDVNQCLTRAEAIIEKTDNGLTFGKGV